MKELIRQAKVCEQNVKISQRLKKVKGTVSFDQFDKQYGIHKMASKIMSSSFNSSRKSD